MKRLVLLAAIAAIAATTPALARSHHKARHHVARHRVAPGGPNAAAYGARPSQCVYVNGRYAGCDPDPNVRRSLVDEYYWLHRPFD
jgi:hypothetical protein